MKPKTLKDFEIDGIVSSRNQIPSGMVEIPTSVSLIFEGIKQSAIEDIKEENKKWGAIVNSAKVNYIKWKFNITEEDVKWK